ncbi:MAG: hypothetical protein CEN91_499 [Candidatus Berkelbacteria bacterium Licking1014_85]|uniref:Uncharacterized protein n=1 Tax=Candidatus Berkelbacteria bacterium Licking1014_85 TaxID=2017148 RepID=A0A554LHE3_9BACT|nr:MAG: hypothetical protein CEN91_499 [Candidatus Berkelbacteria bacterium Licking1014_85]
MEDKTLTCADCNGEFAWTANEQQFYADRNYTQPKRCKDCRDKFKQKLRDTQVKTEITCRECGKKDTVPFEVKGDPNSLLCADCFAKSKGRPSPTTPTAETTEDTSNEPAAQE